jgi:N-acetylglucosamine-6-phosphate deacetylase
MTDSSAPQASATLHLLSSCVLVDGRLQQGIVEVEHGVATSVLATRHLPEGAPDPRPGVAVVDVGDAVVAPVPLDLHFHGAGGIPVPPVGSPTELDDAIEQQCVRDGWCWPGTPVGYDYLATLPATDIGASDGQGGDPLVSHVAAAARGARDSRRCRGLRLEGTFVSPRRAGIWPPEMFRTPDVGLLQELVDVADEERRPLRVLDVAPELPGAIGLIERARELGVVVSIGHSDATYEEALRAIDAGATLATHTFNAMRPFHHRDPGVLAAVLSDRRVWCELVCDGEHVAPGAIALAAAAAGERLVAVSDASPFAGTTAGEHEWLGRRIVGDGTRLHDGDGTLAGAARLLTGAAAVLVEAGVSRRAAFMAVAVRPLLVLDPDRTAGLEVGDRVWVGLPAAPA